jgi:hypothetical protein
MVVATLSKIFSRPDTAPFFLEIYMRSSQTILSTGGKCPQTIRVIDSATENVSVMSQRKVVGQSGGALKVDRPLGMIPNAQMKELIQRKQEKKDNAKWEWYANDNVVASQH